MLQFGTAIQTHTELNISSEYKAHLLSVGWTVVGVVSVVFQGETVTATTFLRVRHLTDASGSTVLTSLPKVSVEIPTA